MYNFICALFRSQKSRFISLGLAICCGICLISAGSRLPGPQSAVAASPSQTAAPAKNPAAKLQGNANTAQVQPAKAPVHALTEAAMKMGVLSCLKRINQVTTFLTANAKSGVFAMPAKADPDQHVFSASFEILPPDNSVIYATASFFPNSDAVYDTVQYVDKSPRELETTVFRHLKRKSVLKKNIILLDGGAVKVFLMPAGKGCVVIKKEIVQ